VPTNTVKANITEISAGFGYTAGGSAITITSSSQTSGTYRLIGDDVTITASGGDIGPFRYVVLYNDTATNDELIAYADYGTAITVTTGTTLTLDLDQSAGILVI
jgi:hypothetical protein